MSRSWHENWRQLVADVVNTFRLHFKQVKCRSTRLRIRASAVYFEVPIYANTFGGQLVKHTPKQYPIETRIWTGVINYWLPIIGHLDNNTTIIRFPRVVIEMAISSQTVVLQKITLLPKQLAVIFEPIVVFKAHLAASIGTKQLQFKKGWESYTQIIARFKRPITFSLPRFRTKAFKLSAKQRLLPIVRVPIPTHRFTVEQRNQFRSILASQAQLSPMDIQLIGIYDRIYLGLYQSMTQGDDGSLHCVPKTPLEVEASKKQLVAAYFIIGKSLRSSTRLFKAILPMKDLVCV